MTIHRNKVTRFYPMYAFRIELQMHGVYSCKDVFHAFIYFTLDEMWVIGLMWRQDGCHLVVVGGMDVLINTVPGQLYLLRITQVINSEGRRGFLIQSLHYIIFTAWETFKMNVIVRADLRQSQMDRRCLWDVHDLPVRGHDEDESVQRLRRKRQGHSYLKTSR